MHHLELFTCADVTMPVVLFYCGERCNSTDDRLRGHHRQANANTCSLGSMRGTSMATPMVAGGLLLIRQYFTEGWYPSGAPNSSRSYTPLDPS